MYGYLDLITRALTAGLLVWFALLAAIIAGRVLNGDISSSGFLHTARGSRARVAPERVLSMMVFPIVILSFAYNALHSDVSGPHPSLPEISENLLMMLTGGNAIYLAGKIARMQ